MTFFCAAATSTMRYFLSQQTAEQCRAYPAPKPIGNCLFKCDFLFHNRQMIDFQRERGPKSWKIAKNRENLKKIDKNHEKIKNERVNADFWRIHKNRRFEEGFWFFAHFFTFSWAPVQQKSEKIRKYQKSLPKSSKNRLHFHEIIGIREESRKKSTSKCHEIIEMKGGVDNLCAKNLHKKLPVSICYNWKRSCRSAKNAIKSCRSVFVITENAAAGRQKMR